MYRRKTLTGSPESYACNQTDKTFARGHVAQKLDPSTKKSVIGAKRGLKESITFSDKTRSIKRFVEGINYDNGKDKGTSENGRKI